MEIFDKYEVSDSQERGLRGFVILSDADTGEIYVKKHNLILNEGRRVIMSKLLDNFTVDTTNNVYKDYEITKVYISDWAEEPDYEDKYSEQASHIIKVLPIIKSGTSTGELSAIFTGDLNSLYASIQLEFTLTSTGDFTDVVALSSLGLIMESQGSQGSPLLFSRITFDPVPVSGGEKNFKLTYYIYF